MKTIFILFVSLILTQISIGQALLPLGDLNPGENASIPSGNNANTLYEGGIYFDDYLIFGGFDTIHGVELFKYDGENIELIKEIRGGIGGSNPSHFHLINDQILFIAYDTLHGYEWRRTNGTEDGTLLVKDIKPGKGSGVNLDEYYDHKVVGDYLYFSGEDEDGNEELWKTDGTEEGTVLVKNIGEDFNNFNTESSPTDFYEFDGKLVFSTISDGFWITDGTEAGTIQLSTKALFNFANLDSIFIYQDNGLWKSDGTPENTVKYANVGYSSYYNHPGNRFAKVGDVVVFPGFDEEHGDELWRTDGTAEGTYLLKDMIEGSDGYPPQNLVSLNGKVYYRGKSNSTGTELFKTDGTSEGTGLAINFVGGSSSGFSVITRIRKGNGFLAIYRGNTPSLHITTGSSDSLKNVTIPGNIYNPPKNFYAFNDKLLFYAFSDNTGYEPYLLDITKLFTPADDDNDGYTDDIDCDDNNASINPDQEEIPYNGVDDDCNSATRDDDIDEDGYNNEVDCDDNNASINPDAEDIPDNSVDENCDGEDAISSSLSELDKDELVYPNPVEETLHLNKNAQIEIFNLNGMLLIKSANKVNQVNVSSLRSGIYIIRFHKNSGGESYKFTKM